MVHDASSGFHDIKPLPTFSPLPLELLVAAVVVLASLALLSWYFKREQRRATLVAEAPSLSPFDEAMLKLDRLLQEVGDPNTALRDLGTRASLALRGYFGRVCRFSATELTNREFSRMLDARLRVDPVVGGTDSAQREFCDSLLRRSNSMLNFCELVTFSNQSELRFSKDRTELAKRLAELRALVIEDHQRRTKPPQQLPPGPPPSGSGPSSTGSSVTGSSVTGSSVTGSSVTRETADAL